jgi:NADH-quinone oxidoreductase subunit C
MSPAAVARLRERFPDGVEAVAEFRGETTVVIRPARLVACCRYLREEPDLAFEFLSDLTAVDWLGRRPRFEVVYHLNALGRRERLRLKVRTDATEPVPSVTGVWPTANWHEREAFDLFGIRFEGHPDLRRILMPDDWEGHPLRKDFPVEDAPRWWEEAWLRER